MKFVPTVHTFRDYLASLDRDSDGTYHISPEMYEEIYVHFQLQSDFWDATAEMGDYERH